jgi:uncharacterized protein
MNFEWDARKARQVLNDRGIDFKEMTAIFANDMIVERSDQNGEERWLAIGELNGKCFVVVHTRRGDTIRIITARRARGYEERQYRSRNAG